jgi:hypothetical protein
MQDTLEMAPWARAVIRKGRITLNAWTPNLMTGGPTRPLLARLRKTGTVLADLYSDVRPDGTEELIVEWIPDTAGDAKAVVLLTDWASQVGYTRVWFPDSVVDLSDRLFSGGAAKTTCATCGLSWEDDSADFWAMVRTNGYFAACCPVCNGSLPEWQPVEEELRS